MSAHDWITLAVGQSSNFRSSAKDLTRRWGLSLMIAFVAVSTSAQGQRFTTFTTLYSFRGADGNQPLAGVVRDTAGNLYGTTYYGGLGSGVVFKLEPSGKETTLHEFTCGSDGCSPAAPLILDSAGNLYGTTTTGGDPACLCGVVFKMDKNGSETVLHSFTGGEDGAVPAAGLIRDAAGNLYGTTSQGGHLNNGIVFKVDVKGKETVLYRFRGGTDGSGPSGRVIRDSAGNFYGTTLGGGHMNGVVFKLDANNKESVLYRFRGGVDGSGPLGGVVRDSAGSLYGMTFWGGDLTCVPDGHGCGTIFKVDSTGIKTTLHSFTGDSLTPVDGSYPTGGLIRDPAGNLYGTTWEFGTIFEVNAAGQESVTFIDGFPRQVCFATPLATFTAPPRLAAPPNVGPCLSSSRDQLDALD